MIEIANLFDIAVIPAEATKYQTGTNRKDNFLATYITAFLKNLYFQRKLLIVQETRRLPNFFQLETHEKWAKDC